MRLKKQKSSLTSSDELFLQHCCDMAWAAQTLALPNPSVGALVVDSQGEIIGRGVHKIAGAPHAEVLAIKEAYLRLSGDEQILVLRESAELHEYIIRHHRGLFRDCALYVSLEPCNHYGKTPPCASLVGALGFRRVIMGASEEGSHAAGGAENLRLQGIEVLCANLPSAKNLLLPFLSLQSKGRFVLFKLAMRLDGSYTSGRISGAHSRTFTHNQRSVCDMVCVGGATWRSDAPRLTAREVEVPYTKKAPKIGVISQREGNSSFVEGHSACGDFLASASLHSLRRMSNTPHSLSSHSPKNSSAILECLAESSPKDSESISESTSSESYVISESTLSDSHSISESRVADFHSISESVPPVIASAAKQSTESNPHTSLESPVDSESTSGGVYLHRDKNKIARSANLEASSGWGIVKGEGATSQFKPLPLNKKENTESKEVNQALEVKALDSETIDSESKGQAESAKTLDSEKQYLESSAFTSLDSKTSFIALSQKEKGFIPSPLPLAPKRIKPPLFLFGNQGECLAYPLLAKNRRRGTTARLVSDFWTPRSGRDNESLRASLSAPIDSIAVERCSTAESSEPLEEACLSARASESPADSTPPRAKPNKGQSLEFIKAKIALGIEDTPPAPKSNAPKSSAPELNLSSPSKPSAPDSDPLPPPPIFIHSPAHFDEIAQGFVIVEGGFTLLEALRPHIDMLLIHQAFFTSALAPLPHSLSARFELLHSMRLGEDLALWLR